MPSTSQVRHSPWLNVLLDGQHGARVETVGLHVTAIEGMSTCNVIAGRGGTSEVESAVWRHFDLELPSDRRQSSKGSLTAAWDGRERWRFTAEGLEEGELCRRLLKCVDNAGVVIDQSHGLATLRISGPAARAVLAKGSCVDFDMKQFGPGDVALTQIAHIGVHITQRDKAPTFEIQLFRSMVGSFTEWLMASGGEFGIDVS